MTAGATVLQAAVLPDGQLEAAAEPVRRGGSGLSGPPPPPASPNARC